MSYSELILGTRSVVYEQVYESRIIVVPTGSPAPTPADGYTIDLIATNIYGVDIYTEYRAYERAQP